MWIFLDVLLVAGLLINIYLFGDTKHIPKQPDREEYPKLSVIIPVRNEAKTLPPLLDSLMKQTFAPYEIICVDDESEDDTAAVIRQYPQVKYLASAPKPEDWIGKSWACHQGSWAAQGEVFLFLDADVRLGENAIKDLMNEYMMDNTCISVQPYHRTESFAEGFSLFFNLTQAAANGNTRSTNRPIGLNGPVILISRKDYAQAGGHAAVKDSLIEDLALGERLRDEGIDFHVFVGKKDFRYQMYPDGFKSLTEGWVKNIAYGAAKTPPKVFASLFCWYASMSMVAWGTLHGLFAGSQSDLSTYGFFYLLWLGILFFEATRVGRFSPLCILLFPLVLLYTLLVFIVSLFKKIFGLRVRWKGRTI